MWESLTRKTEEEHVVTLEAKEANLQKRETEHKTYTDKLVSDHNSATEEARSAQAKEMQARLDEMHSNDRKYREDLDAADREKARLTTEHYQKL